MDKRTVGIDYGAARIGMALSDPTHLIASPVPTLAAQRKSEATVRVIIEAIESLEKEYRCEISRIVVGMPLRMNGQRGLQADEVHHLMDLLREASPREVVALDERLTTVQAERSLREANLSRKKRSKVVDSVAAVLILQTYLDSLERP